MKHLKLFESYFINEDKEPVACPYYDDKEADSGYVNYWKDFEKLSEEEKKKELDVIRKKVAEHTKSIKDDYTKWFNDPDTIKKFSDKGNKVRAKMVSEYIPKIAIKMHLKSTPENPSKTAWGYFNTKNPNEIHVNLFNFFNGKHEGNKSIRDTIKHEMAHAIDDHFAKNQIRAYNATHASPTSQEEYQMIYLINDKDQYARLNILRGVLNAGPIDTGEQLLDKFMKKVKEKVITSDSFTFHKVINKKGFAILVMEPIMSSKSGGDEKKLIKGRLDRSQEVYTQMQGHNAIMVDGKESFNIEQLFANFAIINDENKIAVSMESIAKLNQTSASIKNVLDQNIA